MMGFCVAGEHGVVGRILPMTSSVPCIAALIWYHTMTLSDKTQWYRVVKLLSSVRDLSEMIYVIRFYVKFYGCFWKIQGPFAQNLCVKKEKSCDLSWEFLVLYQIMNFNHSIRNNNRIY